MIILNILLLLMTNLNQQSLKVLTPEEKRVIIDKGTEAPFTGKYYKFTGKGTYHCRQCGVALYRSSDKFDSGCGWPSFTRPIQANTVIEKKDISHFMVRTEVRSRSADSHLGHLFTDGPSDKGGLRYCINSASLRFIPISEMENEGYSDYLKLFDSQIDK